MDHEEDSLLLDNIDEFVNDENRIVTYKWISMTLHLDVNTSKRLLERFTEENRDLNVLYFVGGWKKTDFDAKTLSYIIVKKENLLKAKESFLQITCCDIYSIQKCPIQDSSILYSIDSDLVINNLDSLNKYNTIQCHPSTEKRSVENNLVNHSVSELAIKAETTHVISKAIGDKKLPKNEVVKDAPALSFFGNKHTVKKTENTGDNTLKKKNDVKSSISDAFNKSVKNLKPEKLTVNEETNSSTVKLNGEACVEQNFFGKNKETTCFKEEKSIKNSKNKTNDSSDCKVTTTSKIIEVSALETKIIKPSNKYTEKIEKKVNKQTSLETIKPDEADVETIKPDEADVETIKPDEADVKKKDTIQAKINELPNKTKEIIKHVDESSNKNTESIKGKSYESTKKEKKESDESSNSEKSISLKPVDKEKRKKEHKDITMDKQVKVEERDQTKKTSPKKRKLTQEESDSDDDFENFLESNKNSSKSKSTTKSYKKKDKIDEDVDVEIVAPTPEPPAEIKVKRRKKVKNDAENDSNQQHLSFNSTQEQNFKENSVCINSSTGKRRGHRQVLKSNQYFGEEGYMVTKSYYEMESFSEESDSETQTNKSAVANEKIVTDNKRIEKNSISKQKSKHQASLMSFFKNK